MLSAQKFDLDLEIDKLNKSAPQFHLWEAVVKRLLFCQLEHLSVMWWILNEYFWMNKYIEIILVYNKSLVLNKILKTDC